MMTRTSGVSHCVTVFLTFRSLTQIHHIAVAELTLPPREEIVSLNLVNLSGRTFFSLGTVLPAIPTDVHSVPRGFIRLVEGINDETFGYKLDIIAELDVGGPVRDSKAIWDQLVVAVDNRVGRCDRRHLGRSCV